MEPNPYRSPVEADSAENPEAESEDPTLAGDDIFTIRRRVVAEFEEFEKNFRTKTPFSWMLSLVGPFLITVIILGIITLSGHGRFASQLIAHAGMTFFLFGRLIILVGGEENSKVLMTPVQLFFMVTYLDFMIAMFVAFHMGFLFKMPYFGKMLAEFVGDGQYLLERNPWIKRIAYGGLVLFVVFPTSTTGSVGGSIFGRLLGLGRWTTVSAIFVGSVLGNGLMLLLSQWLTSSAFNNNWVKFGGVLAIVGVFVLLERRYRAMKRSFIEEEKLALSKLDSSLKNDGETGDGEVSTPDSTE